MQQLQDPELVPREGCVDLEPQLDSFLVFFKSSVLQLMFATVCDISGYLKSTQHLPARPESPFNVYSLFCTEGQKVIQHVVWDFPSLSSSWAETPGTAASLSPTLPCQKESRNLDAGPLSAPVLILSPWLKHWSHYGQAAIILPHIWSGDQCYPRECIYRWQEGDQVLSSASADGPSYPSPSLRFP